MIFTQEAPLTAKWFSGRSCIQLISLSTSQCKNKMHRHTGLATVPFIGFVAVFEIILEELFKFGIGIYILSCVCYHPTRMVFSGGTLFLSENKG